MVLEECTKCCVKACCLMLAEGQGKPSSMMFHGLHQLETSIAMHFQRCAYLNWYAETSKTRYI